MYELTLTGAARERFKQLAKERMQDQGISMKDLADKIERPVNSIYGFFNSYQKKTNRFLAAEIANALGIERSEI